MVDSDSNPDATAPRWRIGIVGGGRTRQGLGPFLASAVEEAGSQVVGVAGRDPRSARRAAEELSRQLGHEVVAHDDVPALAGAVDAVVVAAPVPAHLPAMQAAAAAGVPCLCEKPLVAWRDATAGLRCVEGFVGRNLLLAENCQWPFVLPALFELHPALRGQLVRTVAMGLGPAWPGPTMVEDSLSHVLSLVQELRPWSTAATAQHITQSDASADAEHNLVRFRLVDGAAAIDVELHLRRCAQQPRPAWFAVNDCRVDRRLGPDYTQAFVAADGRAVAVRDPLRQLVYRFLANLSPIPRERLVLHAETISVRLGLYASILGTLQG